MFPKVPLPIFRRKDHSFLFHRPESFSGIYVVCVSAYSGTALPAARPTPAVGVWTLTGTQRCWALGRLRGSRTCLCTGVGPGRLLLHLLRSVGWHRKRLLC